MEGIIKDVHSKRPESKKRCVRKAYGPHLDSKCMSGRWNSTSKRITQSTKGVLDMEETVTQKRKEENRKRGQESRSLPKDPQNVFVLVKARNSEHARMDNCATARR